MDTYIVQSTAHQEREGGWIATRQFTTEEVAALGPSAALWAASLPKGWNHSVSVYCPSTGWYGTAIVTDRSTVWTSQASR